MKRIQIASTGKRILAALIDIVIAVGISCLFYFCVFYKAVSTVQHFDQINETIKSEQLKSKLYIEKDGKIVSLLVDNPNIKHEELEPVVHNFYTVYLKEKDAKYDEYWYDTHVLYLEDYKKTYEKETISRPEIILYKWVDDGAGGKKAEVNRDIQDIDKKLDEFYRGSFSSATTVFYLVEPMLSLTKKMSLGKLRSGIYASLVGTIIPYLIIPLCIKNNKTIGKLCFSLIVLTDDGYYYKKWKNIIRYLAFYIIEVFGGVITIGLTLILSSCLALFSLKKRALHDFIAFSVVVDEKYSVFFKDEEEEVKYKELNEKKKAVTNVI